MEAKIQLRHPAGKKAVSMTPVKYEPLKKAILDHLKSHGPSTQKELMDGVAHVIQSSATKFEGSVPWHTEWVKLDLEARKEIIREAGTGLDRYSLPEG